MLGVAMCVGRVLARPQDYVVLQEAVQHIQGLARRAADCPRAVDRELVEGVRINGDCPVIVAQVPRIEHA